MFFCWEPQGKGDHITLVQTIPFYPGLQLLVCVKKPQIQRELSFLRGAFHLVDVGSISHGVFEFFCSIVVGEIGTPRENKHDNNTSTVNEDVFRIFCIEHGDFPACHVSFQACNVFEAIYLLYLWKPLMKCHFDNLCTPQHLCNLMIFIDVTDVGSLFRPIYQVTKRSIVRCLDSLKKSELLSSTKNKLVVCFRSSFGNFSFQRQITHVTFLAARGVGIKYCSGCWQMTESTELTIMKPFHWRGVIDMWVSNRLFGMGRLWRFSGHVEVSSLINFCRAKNMRSLAPSSLKCYILLVPETNMAFRKTIGVWKVQVVLVWGCLGCKQLVSFWRVSAYWLVNTSLILHKWAQYWCMRHTHTSG